MPGSRDEDLNWLYGRGKQPSGPEPTRVLTPPPSSPPPAFQPPSSPPNGPPYGPPPSVRPAGPTGPAGPEKPAKRRRPVRTVLGIIAALVLLSLIWLVGVPAYAWSHVGRVDAEPSGSRPADQPGQTFLLVGSDSREGLTKAEQKKLGTGSVGGQRTDTMMILYVPPSGKPALISLPRDSFVSIPKNGKNKINAAYQFGGPELLVQTVEGATGLRVDGYLEVGFGGFVNVIDAVGGIRMCPPTAIKDKDSHLNLKKGCQILGGVDALGYVRMRKADPRGDLGRVERQREMLAAVAKKAASPASILNPVRYWKLCNASTDSIKLGRETTLFQMVRLGLAMKKIAAGDGLALTVPISNPDAQTSAGSAVLWDDAKAKAMFADIAKGTTAKLASYTR